MNKGYFCSQLIIEFFVKYNYLPNLTPNLYAPLSFDPSKLLLGNIYDKKLICIYYDPKVYDSDEVVSIFLLIIIIFLIINIWNEL